MTQYRRRAHAAQTESAVQWNGENILEVTKFCHPTRFQNSFDPAELLRPDGERYPTYRGLLLDPQFPMWVDVGDFITKNEDTGELDVWDQEHFGATYELATPGYIGPADIAAQEAAPAFRPLEVCVAGYANATPLLSEPVAYLAWCENTGHHPLSELVPSGKPLSEFANKEWRAAEDAGEIYFDDTRNPKCWRLTDKGRKAARKGRKAARDQAKG